MTYNGKGNNPFDRKLDFLMAILALALLRRIKVTPGVHDPQPPCYHATDSMQLRKIIVNREQQKDEMRAFQMKTMAKRVQM